MVIFGGAVIGMRPHITEIGEGLMGKKQDGSQSADDHA